MCIALNAQVLPGRLADTSSSSDPGSSAVSQVLRSSDPMHCMPALKFRSNRYAWALRRILFMF